MRENTKHRKQLFRVQPPTTVTKIEKKQILRLYLANNILKCINIYSRYNHHYSLIFCLPKYVEQNGFRRGVLIRSMTGEKWSVTGIVRASHAGIAFGWLEQVPPPKPSFPIYNTCRGGPFWWRETGTLICTGCTRRRLDRSKFKDSYLYLKSIIILVFKSPNYCIDKF